MGGEAKTDIVERLRELADRADVVFDPSFSWPWRQAADEIERLREVLREFVWLWPRPFPSAPEDMKYQQACIDKARAALGDKQ